MGEDVGRYYCADCDVCEPAPFEDGKTPCWIKAEFSDIQRCEDLPEDKEPPNRSFLCEQTAQCYWGYGGYDYQAVVWPQPAGTTVSAYDENAVIQYFHGIKWGECEFDMDNLLTCFDEDLAEGGQVVCTPNWGPPSEILKEYNFLDAPYIKFEEIKNDPDIYCYRLVQRRHSMNILVQFDTKF